MRLFNRSNRRNTLYPPKSANRKKIIFFLLFLGLLILIGLLLFRFPVLTVSKLSINKTNVDCITDEEISSYLKVTGKNILFLNFNAEIEQLKKQHLCVLSVSFKRQLPNSVEIEVSGREAIFKVFKVKESTVSASLKQLEATSSTISSVVDFTVDNREGEDFFIDRDGLVFKLADESKQLDNIGVVSDLLGIGKQLPGLSISGVEKIIQKIKEISLDVKSYKISKNSKFLLVDGNIKLIFLIDNQEQRGDFLRLIERQLASLQLILQKDKMDSNDLSDKNRIRVIERIDLSYDKPIIIYSTKR